MIDEGHIKFDCLWNKTGPLIDIDIANLDQWRDKLYQLKLIGAYNNGIGYGNISQLHSGHQFVISGSATGNLEKLDLRHYALVMSYQIDKNQLECKGPVRASSESMTHASIYENDEYIEAVIHVHHLELWKALKHKVPTTSADVPYGTPEMAKEIDRLFVETDVGNQKIIAMAGHEEGIITFGNNLEEAGQVLLDYFDRFNHKLL